MGKVKSFFNAAIVGAIVCGYLWGGQAYACGKEVKASDVPKSPLSSILTKKTQKFVMPNYHAFCRSPKASVHITVKLHKSELAELVKQKKDAVIVFTDGTTKEPPENDNILNRKSIDIIIEKQDPQSVTLKIRPKGKDGFASEMRDDIGGFVLSQNELKTLFKRFDIQSKQSSNNSVIQPAPV